MNHEIDNEITMEIHGEPVVIKYNSGTSQEIPGIYCLEETERVHGNQTEFGFIESLDFIQKDLDEMVDNKTLLEYDGNSYHSLGSCLPIGRGMVSVRLRRQDNV